MFADIGLIIDTNVANNKKRIREAHEVISILSSKLCHSVNAIDAFTTNSNIFTYLVIFVIDELSFS